MCQAKQCCPGPWQSPRYSAQFVLPLIGHRPKAHLRSLKPQFPLPMNGYLCLGNFWVIYLDSSLDPRAVHPTGHIDCVSPDVILGPASTNHSSHHRTNVDA